MRHDRGSAGEPYQAQAPGQALAEKQIVAVVKNGLRKQFAFPILRLPRKAAGKAFLARLPRRVLHRPAIAALLQLEAAERGGCRKAERDPAARPGRQRRQAGPQNRIFSFWFRQHESTAAPDPSPRSKLIMPKPLTNPSFASFTWRGPACPPSWRIASTSPRKPPPAPAWPT